MWIQFKFQIYSLLTCLPFSLPDGISEHGAAGQSNRMFAGDLLIAVDDIAIPSAGITRVQDLTNLLNSIQGLACLTIVPQTVCIHKIWLHIWPQFCVQQYTHFYAYFFAYLSFIIYLSLLQNQIIVHVKFIDLKSFWTYLYVFYIKF